MEFSVNFPPSFYLTLFQTLAAANVYHAIVRGVEDARRTALAAFEAAGAAVSRAEDRGSGDNLGVRAELSRVRSEDLFQASFYTRMVQVFVKCREAQNGLQNKT